MKNIPQVWLIFLGSILAFLSTILVEYIKNKITWSKLRKNFKIFIKLEFKTINKTLEKFKEAIEKNKNFNFAYLDSLEKSLTNMENARSDVIYLSIESIQEKYFDLLYDLSTYINDSRNSQNFYYNQQELLKQNDLKEPNSNKEKLFQSQKELDDFFTEKRMGKLVESIDLKRRIEGFSKELDEK